MPICAGTQINVTSAPSVFTLVCVAIISNVLMISGCTCLKTVLSYNRLEQYTPSNLKFLHIPAMWIGTAAAEPVLSGCFDP